MSARTTVCSENILRVECVLNKSLPSRDKLHLFASAISTFTLCGEIFFLKREHLCPVKDGGKKVYS